MDESNFVDGLIDYLKQSPTPFHAVDHIDDLLKEAGFIRLYESDL